MSKHTPTPWEVVNGVDIYSVLGAKNANGEAAADFDGWNIAECGDVNFTFSGNEDKELTQAEKEANARHIVKCVNNYERLVDQLKSAISGSRKNTCHWVPEAVKLIKELEQDQ